MTEETKKKIGDKTSTHGASRKAASPLLRKAWRSWMKMRQRCNDPKNNRYNLYGGRGIYVCQNWKKFQGFLSDMGVPPTVEHSIDRINNNKSYDVTNCKWSTRYEQAANRRNSILVMVDGELKSLLECEKISGVKWKTIWCRLKEGWGELELLRPTNYCRSELQRQFKIGEDVKPITEWAKIAGLAYATLTARIERGVMGADILLPVKSKSR